MSKKVFRFGAVSVGGRPIEVGLLYQDERDKVAKVLDWFDGIVVLEWLASSKQSQCSEPSFRKRFSLYGNGHTA